VIEHNCEQYSDEWFRLRRGVPTASEFSSILTPKTGKLSASSDTYIDRLIADTYSLEYPPQDEIATAAMRRGTAMEPESRRWLECALDCEIEQVGFVTTDDGRFGCSPDGLIRQARRGIELKNPNIYTHVKWVREGKMVDEHRPQCHGGLVVSGFDSWLFCSYCPAFQPCPLFTQLVTPDEYTEKLKAALEEFWGTYQAALAKVREMLAPRGAAEEAA
jgi:YqaJ-like viral recombinase domain